MHTLLNDLGEAARRGERLVREQRRAGILDGYDVVLRPVDPGWHRALFGYAVWFSPPEARELAQVVWPDMDGRFPWEAGFGASVRRFQPALWLAPELAPPGPWRVAWRESEWPPRPHAKGLVFASKVVAAGDAVATTVKVFADGDWAFLVEGPFDADNVVLLHLHHVLLDDPSLDELITLAPGTMATRSGPGDAWEVSRHND